MYTVVRAGSGSMIKLSSASTSSSESKPTQTNARARRAAVTGHNTCFVAPSSFLYYYYHHHDIPLMPLPVAINGAITLQGPTRQGDAPQPLTKRAMIIRMSEETLAALASFPAHPRLQCEFGDSPVCIPHLTLISLSLLNPCAHLGYSHRIRVLPHAGCPRVYPA